MNYAVFHSTGRSLKEFEEFIGTHDISKLNQEGINNFKRSVTRNKIEDVIKITQTEKAEA